jgi:hypothetical protein
MYPEFGYDYLSRRGSIHVYLMYDQLVQVKNFNKNATLTAAIHAASQKFPGYGVTPSTPGRDPQNEDQVNTSQFHDLRISPANSEIRGSLPQLDPSAERASIMRRSRPRRVGSGTKITELRSLTLRTPWLLGLYLHKNKHTTPSTQSGDNTTRNRMAKIARRKTKNTMRIEKLRKQIHKLSCSRMRKSQQSLKHFAG